MVRPTSIRTKLIIAVSLLTSSLIVATCAIVFALYERTTKEQVAEAQLALASVVAQDIDEKLTSAHQQLIELATRVDPETLRDGGAAQALLDAHLPLLPFFNNGIFLFDGRGLLIAESPDSLRRGQDFGFREYLATTLQIRRPYIGRPYRSSRPSAPPAIMMTAPVFFADGTLAGVLGGAVDLLSDNVLGRTVSMRRGKTGYFYVFDRDRTMILHPDPARILQHDVPEGANALLDRAIAGYEGTGETVNSRGLHVIASFKQLHASSWIVGVNSPVDEAYAPIRAARRALALVVVVLVVWRIVDGFTRPLLAFTAHVESMSTREGAARRLAPTSRDEIGQLAGAFDRMVADLDDQQRQQRVLQEQLAQAQKMEAVGQLAGGVAHDFNNILAVILTFASSLREELPEGEQRSCAAEIERAAHRAAALTRQLLAFSRKQVLAPEALDVAASLEALAEMIRRVVGTHIQVISRPDATSGYIFMDPAQFEQVIINLAVNARDAMTEGGELVFEARRVELEGADPRAGRSLSAGSYVELRVSDTGTGMDEATASRAFEPFFTTKPKGKGTGLGLPMIYTAVTAAGGAIRLATAPGRGTSFTIHLPRVAPPAPRRTESSRAAPASRGERVLVVEDEPQVRASVIRLLAGAGYDVAAASNGEEGLALFAGDVAAFDLVLTDLVMPGMGGLALGRALAERNAVPVLYMSGFNEEIASGQEHLSPEVFLQKPFDRETLLCRVRAALDVGRRPAVKEQRDARVLGAPRSGQLSNGVFGTVDVSHASGSPLGTLPG
jgi:signal transduction histidine kinase/FixJ family two-component response regulator